MTVHIVKLCVGADSVEDLAQWQAWQQGAQGGPVCGTRAWPKRKDDVLEGGSLYWVIKGKILVRQRIVRVAPVTDDHGERCGLWLDPALVRTEPRPRKAFQGWRYLEPGEAPVDLGAAGAPAELPDDLRRQLSDLGAW